LFQEVSSYVFPPYIDDRFPTIRDFERYVLTKLRHFVPISELELFRRKVADIQAGLDKRNRKLLMTESDRHLLWERRLVASSATLIVVPDALLEHWYQQIDQHLNLAPFADEKEQQQNSSMFRGMVYVDGVRDLADVIEGGTVFRNISLVKPIVKAWELSKYLVVITTFSRCQAECQREVTAWRMEGLQSSTKRGTKRRRVDWPCNPPISRNSSLAMITIQAFVMPVPPGPGEHGSVANLVYAQSFGRSSSRHTLQAKSYPKPTPKAPSPTWILKWRQCSSTTWSYNRKLT
jgi:hypothetical protein